MVENIQTVVMVHTPYHDLVRPAKVSTGEGEADATSRAKRGLEAPLRSVRAEAMAFLASAQATAAEAEGAQAEKPPAKEKRASKPRSRGAGVAAATARAGLEADEAEEEEAAPPPKKPKSDKKSEDTRLTVSASKTLHMELSKLRAGDLTPPPHHHPPHPTLPEQ